MDSVKSVRLSPPQGNPVDATIVSATTTVTKCDVLISDQVGDWDLHLFDGVNATGTVTRFPRPLTVQIELVGFAGRPKSAASLKNMARLCRWIEATPRSPSLAERSAKPGRRPARPGRP